MSANNLVHFGFSTPWAHEEVYSGCDGHSPKTFWMSIPSRMKLRRPLLVIQYPSRWGKWEKPLPLQDFSEAQMTSNAVSTSSEEQERCEPAKLSDLHENVLSRWQINFFIVAVALLSWPQQSWSLLFLTWSRKSFFVRTSEGGNFWPFQPRG